VEAGTPGSDVALPVLMVPLPRHIPAASELRSSSSTPAEAALGLKALKSMLGRKTAELQLPELLHVPEHAPAAPQAPPPVAPQMAPSVMPQAPQQPAVSCGTVASGVPARSTLTRQYDRSSRVVQAIARLAMMPSSVTELSPTSALEERTHEVVRARALKDLAEGVQPRRMRGGSDDAQDAALEASSSGALPVPDPARLQRAAHHSPTASLEPAATPPTSSELPGSGLLRTQSAPNSQGALWPRPLCPGRTHLSCVVRPVRCCCLASICAQHTSIARWTSPGGAADLPHSCMSRFFAPQARRSRGALRLPGFPTRI